MVAQISGLELELDVSGKRSARHEDQRTFDSKSTQSQR